LKAMKPAPGRFTISAPYPLNYSKTVVLPAQASKRLSLNGRRLIARAKQ